MPAFAGIQEGREAFFLKLVDAGIIQKISMPGTIPRIYVNPVFHSVDFDGKSSIVNVVWAYYYEKSGNRDQLVTVYDSITGKRIGIYSGFYGGLNLK